MDCMLVVFDLILPLIYDNKIANKGNFRSAYIRQPPKLIQKEL